MSLCGWRNLARKRFTGAVSVVRNQRGHKVVKWHFARIFSLSMQPNADHAALGVTRTHNGRDRNLVLGGNANAVLNAL